MVLLKDGSANRGANKGFLLHIYRTCPNGFMEPQPWLIGPGEFRSLPTPVDPGLSHEATTPPVLVSWPGRYIASGWVGFRFNLRCHDHWWR